MRRAKATASVESVVDAFVRVRVDGGDVDLGSIKGSVVDVETNGGSIKANAINADVRARTNGGSIAVSGKVVGSSVFADVSPGGDFTAGAIFGDRVHVNTGGGVVRAKSLRVGDIAVVRTSGGGVDVGGLEGAGEEMIALDSGGGDIAVAFGERVHIVHVNSRGGAIAASFPSGFAATTHVVGSYLGETIDRKITVPSANDTASFVSHARIVHGVDDAVARKVSAFSEGASVTLDSGGADVSVKSTSWLAGALAASKLSSAT